MIFSKLAWTLRFSLAEMRNEWCFGLGVALAVCSVLTPTALLWGAKSGMVDTMRSELLRDAPIRELDSMENMELPLSWFAEMEVNPRVAFVIPSVGTISLAGAVLNADGARTDNVALFPSAPGDPLSGGVGLPSGFEVTVPVPCMVTSRLASDLGIAEGNRFSLEVTRIIANEKVRTLLELKCQCILPPDSDRLLALYLPLPVIEGVEDHKLGQDVPFLKNNREGEEPDRRTANARKPRTTYPSFRLYAKSLEDVAPLADELEVLGIQVITKQDRIQKVLLLDAALGKFLSFIIISGAIGGVGALFTSLYLSIERSRRQFAVFQILGIPKFYVAISSVFQACVLVFLGAIGSYFLFKVGSALLSAVLVPGGGGELPVCRLRTSQWGILVLASLSCAVISALLASIRLRFRDPAVIARSE